MDYKELLALLQTGDVYSALKRQEPAVFALLPELETCKGFDQKNSWHIYDVYEHILHVVAGVEAHLPLRLAALLHDIGKPPAFHLDEAGVGHFFGHWDHSVEIFRKYAPCFDLPPQELALVEALIFYHDMNVDRMSDEEILEMTKVIGQAHMPLLFALKRADLLAQAPAYHGLLENLQTQARRVAAIQS